MNDNHACPTDEICRRCASVVVDETPQDTKSWAEESTRHFFAQWMKGEDLEGAIGWCESLLLSQRNEIGENIKEFIKSRQDKGYEAHTILDQLNNQFVLQFLLQSNQGK